MRADDTFDTVLIGSGPPALMHGVGLARRGERIAFIDRSGALGGAWKTVSAFGLEQIEIGVHLLENRRSMNDTIRNLVGPDGAPIASKDFGLLRRRRLSMRSFRIILYAFVVLKSVSKGKAEKSRYALSKLALALRNFSTPFVYPSRGFQSVLESLAAQLGDAGASFISQEHVRRVQVTDAGVTVVTCRNAYRARRIVMSSRANAPVQGFEDLWRSQRTVTIPNLLLRIQDADPTFDGYVEFLGFSVLKRVRNVGALQAERDIGSDAIIATQLRDVPETADIARLVEACRNQLVAAGLVSASARVVDQLLQLHSYNEMPSALLERVRRRFPERMHILRTKDLSDEVHAIEAL